MYVWKWEKGTEQSLTITTYWDSACSYLAICIPVVLEKAKCEAGQDWVTHLHSFFYLHEMEVSCSHIYEKLMGCLTWQNSVPFEEEKKWTSIGNVMVWAYPFSQRFKRKKVNVLTVALKNGDNGWPDMKSGTAYLDGPSFVILMVLSCLPTLWTFSVHAQLPAKFHVPPWLDWLLLSMVTTDLAQAASPLTWTTAWTGSFLPFASL